MPLVVNGVDMPDASEVYVDNGTGPIKPDNIICNGIPIWGAIPPYDGPISPIIITASGSYVAGILSGMADIDAIVLTMSSLSKMGGISNSVAITTITLATFSNILVKAGISWFFGAKKCKTLGCRIQHAIKNSF